MLTLGIVILNYKNYKLTLTLLNHIKDFPEIDHIVVVDNNSPNESYELLVKHQSEKVSVIQSGHNGGYSYGNNYGAKYLIGNFNVDIIGIANPDVIFGHELLKRIKELFECYPDYAVLTGLQSDHRFGNIAANFWDDENTAWQIIGSLCHELFIRPFVNFSRMLFRKNVMKPDRHYTRLQEIINSPVEVNRVWGVGGCLFFIRRSDFEAAGMFDEEVFLYHEEHILAFRINRYLWKKEGIVNTIEFVHDHRDPENEPLISKLNRSMKYLNYMNSSAVHYFNNYITDSRLLQITYLLLLKLRRLKSQISYWIKRLIYHV